MRRGSAKLCPLCDEVKPLGSFHDRKLSTGIGRYCLDCKASARSAVVPARRQVRPVRPPSLLSKSDINKSLSFSEDPVKYARGTAKSLEMVAYLESITYKLSEGQLATYRAARAKYDAAMAVREAPSQPRGDIAQALSQALANRHALRIRYKGAWRTIDPYVVDEKYCVAFCHLVADIRTFRTDRIEMAEQVGPFIPNSSLEQEAKKRITQAPSYRPTYRRRR